MEGKVIIPSSVQIVSAKPYEIPCISNQMQHCSTGDVTSVLEITSSYWTRKFEYKIRKKLKETKKDILH